jgi:hypothetical protein
MYYVPIILDVLYRLYRMGGMGWLAMPVTFWGRFNERNIIYYGLSIAK